MDLTRIILGPVVTEKTEILKARRQYTLKVALGATKVDVKNALKRFYDVSVTDVRMIRTIPKTRAVGRGRSMEKRHRSKKAIVTLAPKSKVLDITAFRT